MCRLQSLSGWGSLCYNIRHDLMSNTVTEKPTRCKVNIQLNCRLVQSNYAKVSAIMIPIFLVLKQTGSTPVASCRRSSMITIVHMALILAPSMVTSTATDHGEQISANGHACMVDAMPYNPKLIGSCVYG